MKRKVLLLVPAIVFASIAYSAMSGEVDQLSKIDLNQRFSTAYKSFKNAEKNNSESTLTFALQTLDLGKKIYPEGDETLAVLYHNAGTYLRISGNMEEAKKHLSIALNIFEKIYGRDSVVLVDTLTELGHASQEVYQYANKSYYRRALKIAKKQEGESSLLAAQINYEIGIHLLNYCQSPYSKKYLEKAHKLFSELLGSQDVRTGMTVFYLAKLKMAQNKYRQAQELLDVALSIFDVPGQPDHRLELTIRAFLVEVYENLGEREKANKHCQAIGKATPWNSNQKARPIFRKSPKYPMTALRTRNEGYVVLNMTVDKYGFAVDPEVIDRLGSKSFDKAALEAIEDMRFTPRFENGHPVDTHNLIYKFTFKIAD